MKKILKRIFLAIAVLFIVIIAAAVLVPILFKSDIQKALQKQIDNNVNAEVNFDLDNLNVTLFSNFPNITVGIDDLSVIGLDEFKGDTLAAINSFELELDLMTVITGDTMKVNGVYLDDPVIGLYVSKSGKANWDIMKSSESEEDTTEATPLSLAVDFWEITNGKIVYYDRTTEMYAKVLGLNHSGSGIITDKYSLQTVTDIKEVTYRMEGDTYLDQYAFKSKLDAVIDLEKMAFTFNENFIQLNEFILHFDGGVSLTEEATVFDLSYNSAETTFKNLLSLIPGVFLDDSFKDIETDGNLEFAGTVNGPLDSLRIPAFSLKLMVSEAMVKYPGVPTAIDNIAIDLNVQNKDGVIDNSIVNLKKFHADMGSNPIDVNMLVEGLDVMKLDGNIQATLNLADVLKMYPMDDLDLKGSFKLNANIAGTYHEATAQMPTVKAAMGLKNGYAKSGDYPPLEDIQLISNAFSDGSMSNSKFAIEDLEFKLDGDAFKSQATFEDFDDVLYDVTASGRIDLGKIMQISPIEGMELAGIVDIVDFKTKGRMSDIENENYAALVSSGQANISNLFYKDEYVLEGMKITKSNISFTPERININSFNGYLSKSDIQVDGYVANYMGYLFSEEDTIIRGQMNLGSRKFNVDEWMIEEEGAVTEVEIEEELEVAAIPKNIGFKLITRFDEVVYDSMGIKNMTGTLDMIDGMMIMKGLNFTMFGSSIAMNGIYNTHDLSEPKFLFNMNIKDMKISDAYEHFRIVQKYAPTADKMKGTFSANIETNGNMEADYLPVYNTLNADGILHIHKAEIKAGDMEVIKKAAALASQDVNDMTITNEKMDIVIANGDLWVKPFNGKLGQSVATIQLNQGLDLTIKHFLNLDMPAKAINGALNSLGASVGDRVNVDIGITGTQLNPKFKVLKTSLGGSVKDQANNIVKQEMDKVNQEADKIKQEVEKEIEKEIEETKKEVEKEVKEQVQNQVKDKFKGLKW